MAALQLLARRATRILCTDTFAAKHFGRQQKRIFRSYLSPPPPSSSSCLTRTAGRVFIISRMFTLAALEKKKKEKPEADYKEEISFLHVSNEASSSSSLLSSLVDLAVDFINHLRTLLRAFQLSVIFTPVIILSPLAVWGSEESRGVWFRILVRTLQFSGPVCVKLGQWASTRRDLFPLRLCQELSKLQRESTPHPWSATEALLVQSYGEDFASRTFSSFSKEPVGSGCCAQVYKGTLRDSGKDVAVKVLHPDIEFKFSRDLKVMGAFVGALGWLFPNLVGYLSLHESLKEFSSLMKGQVNLLKEAANLRRFCRLYSSDDDDNSVVFPTPVERLCRTNVLVETFEEGQHIGDFIESSSFPGQIEMRREIAEIGVQLLLKMVFVDNLVHGDLHPGNILVRPDHSSTGRHRLVILDPGIVSSLSINDLSNMRSVFKAVVMGDGKAVGRLFLEHSSHRCTTPEVFVGEMEAIVLEARSQQLSLARLNVADLLTKVFNTLLTHRVKLEASYASVILAVVVLEGLGRTLDPELDIMKSAIPFLVK